MSAGAGEVVCFAAAGIDVVQVQGGGEPAAAHHFDGKPGFECAASAEGVAKVAFLRADGNVAEHGGGGLGFGDVALFGGRAVAADIANGGRRQGGVFEGEFDAALHGAHLGAGDVAAVAVGAVADDFGDDVCAACLGVFQFFQHHHAAAFAEHEAVACAVIWAGGEFGLVVAAAGGVEAVEHVGFGRAELVCTAGQHHGDFAVFDGFVGVAYALAAGGAGAGGGNQAAGEAEEDGHVGGGGVRHHAHIGVGVEIVGLVGEQQADVEHVGSAAAGRTGGHTHAAVADDGVAEQACLFQCLFGGVGAVLRQRAHAAQLFARPMFGRRVGGQRRAEAGFHFGEGIPRFHAAHGVFACAESGFDFVPLAAEGAHRAHAGNHHPFCFHQHNPPFTAITCRVM